MKTENKNLNVKVLLLGESSVGKTSITQRYVDNTFDDIYLSSVGVDFKCKEVYKNNQHIRLQIWDTGLFYVVLKRKVFIILAGQERFQSIAKSYYRNADAAFIVFDLNNEKSFQKVQFWFNEIEQADAHRFIILVGNKCDLDIRIDDEKVQTSYPNAIYVKVSAKTNENISLLFDTFINYYLQNSIKKQINNDQIEQKQVEINPPTPKKQYDCSC